MTDRSKPSPLTTGLGKAGCVLVERILAEMKENGVEPDAREAEALTAAARMRDREADLLVIVDREGVTITTPSGRVSIHPALVEARQMNAQLVRNLSGISLVDSVGKSPRHVRAGTVRQAVRLHG